MAKPVEREPKKPYTKPALAVYGNVRELTLKVGANGKRDGGTLTGRKHSHL
jgi:hypothetical protein